MTAPDNPVPLKSVKPEEWPERLYGGKAVVRFPSGVESGNWYSKPDAGGDKTREYIRADVARADAEMAVSEAIRRAAEIADGYHRRAIEWAKKVRGLDQHIDETDSSRIADDILTLAPADALAEVQRLRERVTSLSDQVDTIAGQRDAALARVEKLRHQITEASDPDFIWGAMDNVNDMDVTLDQFAAAASRAIRAALDEDARHG